MSGFVYFIETEGSCHVKIGWAKHSPAARMATLQTGCPHHMFVRAFFAGSQEDERRMHRTFADLRANGEWFANVLKLSDFLHYLDDANGDRPCTEEEIALALADCVYGSHWRPGEAYGVKEIIYDDSGDWTPWRDLLAKYHFLATADA